MSEEWQADHGDLMRTIRDTSERQLNMEWARQNLATLAQLRAGTHVCVPREDLERIKEWTCQHGGAGRTLALLTAMLAASTPEARGDD